MAPQHQIVIKTRAGAIAAILTGTDSGFRGLAYRKKVNDPGLLTFALSGESSVIDLLEQDGQVEVWRRDAERDIDWYCDFFGLFRDEERSTNEDGVSTFVAHCPGQMIFLADSIVAYPTDTDGRSLFTADKAETVMKALVTYNATSSGTTSDGRARNVPGWGGNISVEADGAGGNTITYACPQKILLEALQDVARIGALDYDLVKTAAQSWEFRTDTTLGDDRSAEVTFALQFGNMRNPVLRRNRLQERTVAIVGGLGAGIDRAFVVRTGTNHDTDTNSREVFVAGSNFVTNSGLEAVGDVRLDELEARDNLIFDVIQVPSTLYGKHYFFGDLVTGYYQGITNTKQIVGVTVTVIPDREKPEDISVELKNA